jgi:RimJ/RimL family protein N-acetyltransferase
VVFGICTFVFTVAAVGVLLFLGGSFKRLAEEKSMESVVPDSIKTRSNRPLLLEKLLDARHRMMTQNYPGRYDKDADATKGGTEPTNLTRMLLNVAPKLEIASQVSSLVDDKDKKKNSAGGLLSKILGSGNSKKQVDTDNDTKDTAGSKGHLRTNVPKGYAENYVHAYRRCQDKRGGPDIPGHPEARLEAYARAYAGCGPRASSAYRRSYARMYEAVSCKNEGSMTIYQKQFLERPGDIVGRTVRLTPLSTEDHATKLHEVTCGEGIDAIQMSPFNPKVVWGFLEYGPFDSSKEMTKSRVFLRRRNEASFAIVDSNTNRVMGVFLLTNDDPRNLSVEMEAPIVAPDYKESQRVFEACFLLLDRLFAYGYRRVQMTIDAKDHESKKLPSRLGFMQEGILPRHKIVKDASRDSCVYGMLNSDWEKNGARNFLFNKIHGQKALEADGWNEVKEAEMEMWQANKNKE